MLNTWGQLLVFVSILSVFALWRFNLLLSIMASAGWVSFLFYHLSNQPTGITAGDTADRYIVWAVIVAIIAIPIITIMRIRGRQSNGISSVEGDERNDSNSRISTLSSMNTPEYQAYLRTRLRRNRR